MDKVRALVTFANAWSMEDERTHKFKEGITVEYLMCESLKPVENENGSLGVRHCKESIPVSQSQNIKYVPGYYDLVYSMQPGSKGKPELKLTSLEFIEQVIE